MEFLFWNYLKDIVYVSRYYTLGDLQLSITDTIGYMDGRIIARVTH